MHKMASSFAHMTSFFALFMIACLGTRIAQAQYDGGSHGNSYEGSHGSGGYEGDGGGYGGYGDERPKLHLGLRLKIPAIKFDLPRFSLPKITISAKIRQPNKPRTITLPEINLDTSSKVAPPMKSSYGSDYGGGHHAPSSSYSNTAGYGEGTRDYGGNYGGSNYGDSTKTQTLTISSDEDHEGYGSGHGNSYGSDGSYDNHGATGNGAHDNHMGYAMGSQGNHHSQEPEYQVDNGLNNQNYYGATSNQATFAQADVKDREQSNHQFARAPNNGPAANNQAFPFHQHTYHTGSQNVAPPSSIQSIIASSTATPQDKKTHYQQHYHYHQRLQGPQQQYQVLESNSQHQNQDDTTPYNGPPVWSWRRPSLKRVM